MRYEQVKALKAEEFKRLCGVKSETFELRVAIVRLYNQNKQKPGFAGKICLEDQVLMTLDYWIEYRTYFHIGVSWGVAVAACKYKHSGLQTR